MPMLHHLERPSLSKQKLAIFVHDFSATGVVRNAIAVARHMTASGWAVTLITCRSEGALAAEADGLACRTLKSGPRKGLSRTLDLLTAILPLRRALSLLRPAIILSAGNHAHLPVWLATRGMTDVQRIYRISNDLDHGHSIDGHSSNRHWSRHFSPRRLTASLLLHDAARLILVSDALGEDHQLHPALVSGEAIVIPNGVDVEDVRRRAMLASPPIPRARPGEMTVLGVGRLVEQKNFETLVEAAALAHAKRPVRLIILGHGTPEARDRLFQRAEAHDFAGQLLLPGVSKNPFAAMRQADLVALPSLWEGSPNVLLEAMAVGVAVTASTSAGNAADILDEGRHGRLFDPHDAQEMAQAILLQLDPATRILPGNRAEHYDRHASFDDYLAVFQAVAAGHGAVTAR